MMGGEIRGKSIQVVPRLLLALVERVVLGHGHHLHERVLWNLSFDDVGEDLEDVRGSAGGGPGSGLRDD